MPGPIEILSAGAIRRGVDAVAELAAETSGVTSTMQYTSAPKAEARVRGGEQADIVVVPDASQERLQAEGRIVGESRIVVGRSRMAIVVRRGRGLPDVSSVDRLKDALLHADAVVHNEGSSGTSAAALIDRLGLRETLGSRVHVVENSAAMMALVTGSSGMVIALAQGTNALDHFARGADITIAGRFPPGTERVTAYEAAVASLCRNEKGARAFMAALTSAEGRRRLVAIGLE